VAWAISADVAEYEAALVAFRKRVPITDIELEELTLAERGNAFWVSGLSELSAVRTVMEEIDKAIAAGLPMEDFQKSVKEALGAHTLDGHHIETVFRNAVQTAYSAGRWEQLTNPDVSNIRPYWVYDSVLDTRTTKLCRELDGTCKPHDDPFWLYRCPQCHHRCRANLRAVKRREAERRGITQGDPSTEAPVDNWGLAPPLRDKEQLLKREAVSDDLLTVFDERQTR